MGQFSMGNVTVCAPGLLRDRCQGKKIGWKINKSKSVMDSLKSTVIKQYLLLEVAESKISIL
jgi:hypothetical protein